MDNQGPQLGGVHYSGMFVVGAVALVAIIFILADCSKSVARSEREACVVAGDRWIPDPAIAHNGGYCARSARRR